MIVGFLRDFAEAEAAIGNSTGASALLEKASKVAAAMNEHLWANKTRGLGGNDHFISYLDPGTGAVKDFVCVTNPLFTYLAELSA